MTSSKTNKQDLSKITELLYRLESHSSTLLQGTFIIQDGHVNQTFNYLGVEDVSPRTPCSGRTGMYRNSRNLFLLRDKKELKFDSGRL